MGNHIIFSLREFLFPHGCGGCSGILIDREDAYYGLCKECRIFLQTILEDRNRCTICGKSLISEKNSCLSCRGKEKYNEWLINIKAIFPYTGKCKSVLGSYKFGKSLGIANFLAQSLKYGIAGSEPETSREAVLVPVPPKPGKIKKQGWDQIEYLAKILDSCLPVYRCLKRLKSRNQKELNREEREKNLKGRILCVKPVPKTVIIFDDVITTGATLNACAKALLEGGAEKVHAICLFYD